MTTFNVALIREQRVVFTVVVVKSHVLTAPDHETLRCQFEELISCGPVVFMVQSGRSRVRYHGRADLVRWLANVPVVALPWKTLQVQG